MGLIYERQSGRNKMDLILTYRRTGEEGTGWGHVWSTTDSLKARVVDKHHE